MQGHSALYNWRRNFWIFLFLFSLNMTKEEIVRFKYIVIVYFAVMLLEHNFGKPHTYPCYTSEKYRIASTLTNKLFFYSYRAVEVLSHKTWEALLKINLVWLTNKHSVQGLLIITYRAFLKYNVSGTEVWTLTFNSNLGIQANDYNNAWVQQ